MKIALVIGGVVLAIVLLVVAVGWTLPVKHQASREATYPLAADSLFAIIADAGQFPTWRGGVKRVERLPDENGKPSYRETGDDGAIPYVVDERTPPSRMVTRIADASLPFGGRWTYELRTVPSGTTLRITEDGEVYNPLFRFMSKFVFTHHRTIDSYLRDLETRVGAR